MRYVGHAEFRCDCGETFRPTDDELSAISHYLFPLSFADREFMPTLIGTCNEIAQCLDPEAFDHDCFADESDLTFMVDRNIVVSHRHVLAYDAWWNELADAADDLSAPVLEVAA
jgi:hypothetical protein